MIIFPRDFLGLEQDILERTPDPVYTNQDLNWKHQSTMKPYFRCNKFPFDPLNFGAK